MGSRVGGVAWLGDYAIATAAASCCAPNAIGVKDPFGRLAGPFDLFRPAPPPLSFSSSPSPPFLSLCLSGQIANATQTIALLSIDKSAMYMGNVCSQIRRFYQPLFLAFVFCFFFSSPASSFTSALACAWLSYCCCCSCYCCCWWWESARARPDLRQTSCAACFA